MKQVILPFFVLLLFLSACNNDDTNEPVVPENIPAIKADSTYGVVLQENIIYAAGLSHESLNSANSSTLYLLLDVYTPDNQLKNRPVFMFIHGGGFIGGSKQDVPIVNLANYYSSRGWVFISIDYRLKADQGTVPQVWRDYSVNIPIADTAQYFALYPAIRDAKAALRWTIANANTYNISTNHITVGGASAGAISALSLGISNQNDFTTEISINRDPTLQNINIEQSYQIKTIVDFWGSKTGLDLLEEVYGHQRFDITDPPLFIAHGTADTIVPFSSAEDLKVIYEANELPIVCYPLDGFGHGPWNATIENKRLEELAFDFIVAQQNLEVE